MKNIIIGILLVASIALGGLLIQKNNSEATNAAALAKANAEIDELKARVAEQETTAARLGEKLETASQESFSNANAANRLSHELTNRAATVSAPSTNSKPANPFAAMFKNPEMRDMIRKQQKTMMSTMVDKNYADLFKSMNLTPEQTDAMKEAILNKMLGNAEMGMEMMSGDLDSDKRAELIKQMKEKSDSYDKAIKDLLGEENFASYESYEKSMPDRNAVSSFKGQLNDATRLSDDQERSLIAVMSEERQGFKFTTDFGDKSNFSEDMFSRFTEDRIDTYMQERQQLNERYLARAETVLTSEQFASYKKSLMNQEEMTKMAMKMAVQMFAPKK